MGPYCQFCDRRCFVDRVLADGRGMLLATCPRGMEHDRQQCGQDHTTALNPAMAARDEDAWWAILSGPLAPLPNERGGAPALEWGTCDQDDCPRRHWLREGYRHHAKVEVERPCLPPA